MALPIEELLKDRFIVIAPNGYHYPNSPFLDGEILIKQDNGCWIVKTKEGNVNSFYDRHPQNYPNLFRKLFWYEERAKRDIGHVCFNSETHYVKGKVVKVIETSIGTCVRLENCKFDCPVIYCTPITEAEYLSYQNSPAT